PERLERLAIPAAGEAWARAGFRPTPPRVGIFLGVDYADSPDALLASLTSGLGVSFEPTVVIAGGRAAALVVLESAVAHLRQGQVSAALVGGVDSLIRGPVLQRLDAAGALKTEGNPHGVLPGEAAAFLVLERSG